MANIYDMVDEWDDAGTVFNGIKLNVTDTASDASSLLMDLQVGGVSKFKVDKSGKITGTTVSANTFTFGPFGNIFSSGYSFGYVLAAVDGTQRAGVGVGNSNSFYWTSDGTKTNTDLILARDAANTLAQRNSTNAQTFNLYNTYTDASNYERGFMKWNSNVLEIGTEAAGTGAARSVTISAPNRASALVISATNTNLVSFAGFNFQTTSGRGFFSSAHLDLSGQSILTIKNVGIYTNPSLILGAADASNPMIMRNGVYADVKLGNNSAFTNIRGKLTTETAYTAGAPTPTGYIVLYDSTGTAYKVPAEAL